MSGGHFDYGCFKVSQFAEEVIHEIDINDSEHTDSDGWKVGMHLEPETLKMVKRVGETLKLAGELAYATEWLYSGDYGEDTYRNKVEEIYKKYQE